MRSKHTDTSGVLDQCLALGVNTQLTSARAARHSGFQNGESKTPYSFPQTALWLEVVCVCACVLVVQMTVVDPVLSGCTWFPMSLKTGEETSHAHQPVSLGLSWPLKH